MASLQDHLESLRAKPPHVRKRVAFWGAFGITAVIAAFWMASLTATITGRPNPVTVAVTHAETPAQSLIAGVGGFFYDFKDLVFGPKKVTYSSIEVSPGK